MSARRSVVEVRWWPSGVELAKEEVASRGFVLLADCMGRGSQAMQGQKKSPIGLVIPADKTATTPATASESVKTTVIADPERGVSLDVVARQATKLGPGRQKRWPLSDNAAHRTPRVVTIESFGKRKQRVRRFKVDHRLRWARTGQVDIGHDSEGSDRL